MTSSQTNIDPFARVWTWRFQQRIGDVSVWLQKNERKYASASFPHSSQIILLKASLCRSEGRLVESNSLLSKIAEEAKRRGASLPFQYHFQRALNFLIEGEFSVALEYFLLANSVALSVSERLHAHINVLICLENLNLPSDPTVLEIERLLAKAGTDGFLDSVRAQLKAFRLRRLFRQGKIDCAFAEPLFSGIDQSGYQLLWLSRLPYAKSAKIPPIADDLLQRLALASNFHAKSYRFRTVTFDHRLGAAEESKVQVMQQVDRIYLWTWRWLTKPSEGNRQLLAECLRSFDFVSAVKKMTFEDFQMLRNALSWIGIFQKPMANEIAAYISSFSHIDAPDFPIFEYENLWIRYVQAYRNGVDTTSELKNLESHSLYSRGDLDFSGALSLALELPHTRPRRGRRASLRVEANSHQIFWRRRVVVSEALAKLLVTLATRETLSFSEALWIGFGIAQYDSGIHRTKIYNCLERLKNLLPKSISLKTKGSVIYWKAPAGIVEFQDLAPLEKPILAAASDLKLEPLRKERRNVTHLIHPRSLVQNNGGKRLFYRREIEQQMNFSKASSYRWLKHWMKQGLITRSGVGRAATYSVDIV